MVRDTRGRVIDNWTVANWKQLTSTRRMSAIMKQVMDWQKCVQKWKRNKIIRTNTDVRQARQYSKQWSELVQDKVILNIKCKAPTRKLKKNMYMHETDWKWTNTRLEKTRVLIEIINVLISSTVVCRITIITARSLWISDWIMTTSAFHREQPFSLWVPHG